MTGERPQRRRLLRTVGTLGVAGLAGCSSLLDPYQPPYTCTDIDDEPTEEYDAADDLIPFSFEKPSVMERVERSTNEGYTRVAFAKEWVEENPPGASRRTQAVGLIVEYTALQSTVEPTWFRRVDPDATVIGKRLIDGVHVGLVRQDTGPETVRVIIPYPTVVDGSLAYDRFGIEVDANIVGDRQAREKNLSDDPDQTCEAALLSVATTLIDSIPTVSPAETETALSVSPSSATVRHGEELSLTVEAAGVSWVDLFVVSDQGEITASLAVGDEPVELLVTPPEGGQRGRLIRAAEPDRLRVINGVVDPEPGEYVVTILAPGDDGVVTASSTVTVEASE